MSERRTFNTPLREPLNPIIHRLLQAVDWHNSQYFKDSNPWHLQKADTIRQYVRELKAWVYEQEKNSVEALEPGSGGESREA